MDVQWTALHRASRNGDLDIARYRVSLMACLPASCFYVCVSAKVGCVLTVVVVVWMSQGGLCRVVVKGAGIVVANWHACAVVFRGSC